jgi:hypothetical protein
MNGKARIVQPAPFQAALRHQLGGTRGLESEPLGSLYHWHRSPRFTPVNAQRGHWLVARVCAVLGLGEKALEHAAACMNLTGELGLGDFDLAYAHEAVARARAASGDLETAQEAFHRAREAGEAIAGDKDKEVFQSDLVSAPWYGLDPG